MLWRVVCTLRVREPDSWPAQDIESAVIGAIRAPGMEVLEVEVEPYDADTDE